MNKNTYRYMLRKKGIVSFGMKHITLMNGEELSFLYDKHIKELGYHLPCDCAKANAIDCLCPKCIY